MFSALAKLNCRIAFAWLHNRKGLAREQKGRYEKEEWTLSDPTVFCERAVHSVTAASLTRQVTSCFPNDARRCTGSSGRCARGRDTAEMSLLATLPCSARCSESVLPPTFGKGYKKSLNTSKRNAKSVWTGIISP